jgi:hypothetical protein
MERFPMQVNFSTRLYSNELNQVCCIVSNKCLSHNSQSGKENLELCPARVYLPALR